MENGLSQENFYQFLLSSYGDKAKRTSELFEIYLKRLVEVNKVMNLTAIDQDEAVRDFGDVRVRFLAGADGQGSAHRR